MTGLALRLLAAAVLAGASWSSAGAQTPVAGGSSRTPSSGPQSSLDLLADVFGGYDTSVVAPDPDVNDGVYDSQTTYGANVHLAYDRTAERSGVSAGGDASVRSFPAVSEDLIRAYSGLVSARTGVGRRGSFSVSQSAGCAPVNMLALVSAVSGPGVQAAGAGPASGTLGLPLADYGVTTDNQLTADSSLGLGYRLTRDTSLDFGAGYNVSEYLQPAEADAATVWLQRWRATARLDTAVSRNGGVYAGYTYTEDVSRLPDQAAPGGAVVHNLDLGVRYGRQLGFSRRTRVSGQAGSTALNRPGQSMQYTVIGNGVVNHEFGRTWRAAASVQRDVRFSAAYVDPVTANSASAEVSGGLAERTTLRLSAGYVRGTVGTTSDSAARDRFESQSASIQLRHGLTARVGLFAEYFYFDSTFGIGALPIGVTTSDYGRQGVRAGVSVGRLLAGRRRTDDAPR